jgi:hypothetical protein
MKARACAPTLIAGDTGGMKTDLAIHSSEIRAIGCRPWSRSFLLRACWQLLRVSSH